MTHQISNARVEAANNKIKLTIRMAYRKYTVSEIINAIIRSGFTLKRFDEHPAWENEKLPGEFTAIAIRNERDPA